jgi:hypothetical protein
MHPTTTTNKQTNKQKTKVSWAPYFTVILQWKKGKKFEHGKYLGNPNPIFYLLFFFSFFPPLPSSRNPNELVILLGESTWAWSFMKGYLLWAHTHTHTPSKGLFVYMHFLVEQRRLY